MVSSHWRPYSWGTSLRLRRDSVSRTRGSVWVWLTRCTGAVTSSNVSLTDSVSGVLGLGFPRLSVIQQSVNGQFCPVIERLCCMLSLAAAAPFFANLAQRGLVEYPLFGLSLTRNSSGSLTLGASAHPTCWLCRVLMRSRNRRRRWFGCNKYQFDPLEPGRPLCTFSWLCEQHF